jgi:hypothetical protein
MKLTSSEVRKFELADGQSEAIVFDDDIPGFGLRVREGGSRTFVFQYKLGNKHRRITLGPVKALDTGTARNTAKDLYAKVRLGGDPAGEKEHAKLKAGETFEAVAEQYLDAQGCDSAPMPMSSATLERMLSRCTACSWRK